MKHCQAQSQLLAFCRVDLVPAMLVVSDSQATRLVKCALMDTGLS